MNTFDNGRSDARSRANRRLRRMTIGTAMLGVAATGVLGLAAAVSYDGATSDAKAATVTALQAAVSVAGDASDSTATEDAADTAPSVRSTSGSAHASTGGS